METANKHVAAIVRNYNETMKSICQHCGSHFSYLATGVCDYEGVEQTIQKNFTSHSFNDIIQYLSVYKIHMYYIFMKLY